MSVTNLAVVNEKGNSSKMSENNFVVVAEKNKDNDKDKDEEKDKQKVEEKGEAKVLTPMQDLNAALKECGFGRFQIRLLFCSMFGYFCSVFITSTMPYILPNAECDLNMNLFDKGILNASPFVGMILISVVAGFLTDTFGRKFFLVFGYAGIFFFSALGGLSQNYTMLLVCKFFEGIVFAMAHSPCISFTSEYCHSGVRDRVMLLQSSFQSFGQIVIALLSWPILMQNWETSFFDGKFGSVPSFQSFGQIVIALLSLAIIMLNWITSFFNGKLLLHTWNYYLLIISLFSLTGCILYSLMPESPKFLVSQNRFDEAMESLKKVYISNTGKPVETFKFVNIWKDKAQKVDEAPEHTAKTTFSQQVVSGLHNIKPMFRKPLVFYLVLFCVMNYMSMTLYNTIRLWFPQLSTIVEHYSGVDGNNELCSMLDAYTADQRLKALNVTEVTTEVCIPNRSGTETYINTVILGLVCLTPYIISGFLVNKVGKKNLIICFGVITTAATLGLRWSSSKSVVVGLFSLDMALAQSMMSLLQTTTTEVFPTASRTLAVSMMMVSGRIGSLIASLLFPILLNMGCVVPFYTLTVIMLSVTVMGLFLPKKKK